MKITVLLCFLFFIGSSIQWAVSEELDDKRFVETNTKAIAGEITRLSDAVWRYAEVGFVERKSSSELAAYLEKNDFKIDMDVAGMPTAFVASYGSGGPVIALLGEFDALPQLSQTTDTFRQSANGVAGHGCGHNLLGAASAGAAVLVKKWLEENEVDATVKYFGAPAEEGGSGKVYLARDGYFDDVDIVLHWHPSDSNNTNSLLKTLAVISAKFRFYGTSAHAAGTPEEGRSALDAVESMNYMVNMMREHVPDSTRIHYVITDGGGAPNVVPNFSEVYYYVRSPDVNVLKEVFNRVVKAADGAALGTETRMDYEKVGGTYSLLANLTLNSILDTNLRKFGGVEYSETEIAYANEIRKTVSRSKLPELDSANYIPPLTNEIVLASGSTDVGDVSWIVPTAGINIATWVPGTSFHSWQAVAASGMSIGHKGELLAAKTLALSAIDLIKDPEKVKQVWEEWLSRRGNEFQYESLLGDRAPALNYRVKYDQQ